MLSSAYHTESTFVAFESLMYCTPPYSPHGSSRCSTPVKVRKVWQMLSGGTPAESAAIDAAIAL